MLYDRVIRPAEVGVTLAVEDDNATENDKGSQEWRSGCMGVIITMTIPIQVFHFKPQDG